MPYLDLKVRYHLFALFMLCLLVLSGFVGCMPSHWPQSSQTLAPGDYERRLMDQGRNRSYLLHIPPKQGNEPLPVVVNFHGGGGNAWQHRKWTRMNAHADRNAYVVIYPNGTGRVPDKLLVWNAGHCCGYATLHGIDDVGFTFAAIEEASTLTSIDLSRIYLTGLSNGAMMVYRIAAEYPERIAAIAPIAGTMLVDAIQGRAPMPILHIHSLNDPRVPYEGRPGAHFRFPRVERTIDQWLRYNDCPVQADARRSMMRQSVRLGHHAKRLVYGPCRDGVEVRFWQLEGPGHVWPGGLPDYFPRLLGASTDVLNANELMWQFFSQYHR